MLLLSFPLKLKHFFFPPKKSWKRSSIFLHFLLNFIASCHRCRWPFLILIVFFLNAKILPPASEIVPMGGECVTTFFSLKVCFILKMWRRRRRRRNNTPVGFFKKRKRGVRSYDRTNLYSVRRGFTIFQTFPPLFTRFPPPPHRENGGGGNYYIRDTLSSSSSSFVTPKMWNKSVFFYFFPPFAQSFKKEKNKKMMDK